MRSARTPSAYIFAIGIALGGASQARAGRVQAFVQSGKAKIARFDRWTRTADRKGHLVAGVLALGVLQVGAVVGPAMKAEVMALVPDAPGTTYTSSANEPRLLDGDIGHVGWATLPNATIVGKNPRIEQMNQSELGNCGLVSTVGVAAKQNPTLIANALVPNADGTVTFKSHEAIAPRWVRIGPDGSLSGEDPKQPLATSAPKDVRMSAALPRAASIFSGWLGTSPKLMKSTNYASSSDNDIVWGPMLEKGIAASGFLSSHAPTGAVGYGALYAIPAYDVMTLLTGKQSEFFLSSDNTATQVWNALKLATDQHRLVVANTMQPTMGNFIAATAHLMFNKHYYSVLGTEEKLGIRWVQLRNPHGDRYMGIGSAEFNITIGTYMNVVERTEIN